MRSLQSLAISAGLRRSLSAAISFISYFFSGRNYFTISVPEPKFFIFSQKAWWSGRAFEKIDAESIYFTGFFGTIPYKETALFAWSGYLKEEKMERTNTCMHKKLCTMHIFLCIKPRTLIITKYCEPVYQENTLYWGMASTCLLSMATHFSQEGIAMNA